MKSDQKIGNDLNELKLMGNQFNHIGNTIRSALEEIDRLTDEVAELKRRLENVNHATPPNYQDSCLGKMI